MYVLNVRKIVGAVQRDFVMSVLNLVESVDIVYARIVVVLIA